MEHSLEKRYVAKLFANIVGLGFGIVIAMLVPRGLGPRSYGDFSFLSTTFLSLLGFFTLSTSTGFFVKLAQRQNDFGLISFYGQFTLFSILVLFAFIYGMELIGYSSLLFINIPDYAIILAAILGVATWLLQILTQVVDAYGLTVGSEIARIGQKIVGLLVIIILYLTKKLTLINYLYYNIFITLGLILVFWWILERSNYSFFRSWKLSKVQITNYINEFVVYSRPLLIFSIFVTIGDFFDRWLLQKYGGSVEQGFFGLSNQIAAVCFLFSSAMVPLITRELSILFRNNDVQGMSLLYRRYAPLLYGIASFLACFTAVQADKVVVFFGGNGYGNALLPVLVMAFYPIHQTYGQLTASLFFATGKTKLYSQISLIFLVIGLPMIYFILGPQSSLGLNLGATGLAIKFVCFQFIAVNVQLYYNLKFLKLRFRHFFIHQLVSVAFFSAMALFARVLSEGFKIYEQTPILNFITAGFLYTFICCIFIYFFPVVLGLKKNEIEFVSNRVSIWIKHYF